MTKFKSKLKKATIIPALCMMASVLPTNAKANWAAFGNLASGIATGLARSTPSSSRTTVKTPIVRAESQPVYQEAPVIYYTEGQYHQAQQEYATTHSQSRTTQTPVLQRAISKKIIRQPGQPTVIETVIEEVPVQASRQQQPVRYTTNQGR